MPSHPCRGLIVEILVALAAFASLSGSAIAYNGHTTQEGPLTLVIGEIPVVEKRDALVDVPISLENAGPASLAISVRAAVIDDCQVVGPSGSDRGSGFCQGRRAMCL